MVNTLAWNTKVGLVAHFVGFFCAIVVMIRRDSWGHLYLSVRSEMLGFVKDEPL